VNAAVKLPLSARTVAIVLLVTALLVAGAGWFIVVSPKRSKAGELAASIEAKQTELATATQARQPKGRVRSSEGVLDAALPTKVAMPQVVDQLNGLARRSDVTLASVAPQPSVPGTGYVTVPVNVVVEGRYFAVQKFLHLVRTQVRLDKSHVAASGRLFDVQSVALQQTEPAPTISANLILRTFYYSPTTLTPPEATTTTSGTSS
jgi:Tfp pilus assembly protein PilO